MAKTYPFLSLIAAERGDYDAALDWITKALVIQEEVGDRANMALSTYRIGTLAERCGKYDAAIGCYRKSLQIMEQLGDHDGMVSRLDKIGRLLTERGDPATGLSFNLQSLALRSQIGLPGIRMNLLWLARQRDLLGQDRFRTLLIEHLGDEGAATVGEWLQREPPEPSTSA